MADGSCPFVLRVPTGATGKYLRFSCILDALHDDQHMTEIPGSTTQPKLSDGWAPVDGVTRVYWSAPM